jgi:hypothetical protein
MNKVLSFCFKGERNYIHGTDIVPGLFDAFTDEEISNIDIKFNGIVQSNLVLLEGTEQDDAKVNARIMCDGTEKFFQLVESDQKVECRHGYDESLIISNTDLRLEDKSIDLKEITGFTFWENFVAMNKFLLQKVFPDEKGKWYFTRLEQTRVIDHDVLITVKLIKNFNFRLTKSDILCGDEVIGSVYFSMIKE